MKKIILMALTAILVFNIFFLIFFKPKSVSKEKLINFTTEQLKKYDGTNNDLPIYMAYNGDVYDVSAGRDYYKVGGTYHDLAGKDSSKELNIAGGGIIKVKYKIIGKLIP